VLTFLLSAVRLLYTLLFSYLSCRPLRKMPGPGRPGRDRVTTAIDHASNEAEEN
jgi:hypothetical protein